MNMKDKNILNNLEELNLIAIPKRTLNALDSLEKVKSAFCVPATVKANEQHRQKLNDDFENAGGYESLYSSLTEHAAEMGQYPVTSFVGYGALQQIAQQGLIRACVQTVADDMAKKWIKLTGAEADKLAELENLLNSKYHLKKVFHQAVTTTGYMGGALIYIDTGFNADPSEVLTISEKSQELGELSNLSFRVIDPVNACPSGYNAFNALSADYYKPSSWIINGTQVDASRLLTCIENEPPLLLKPNYNFLGIPQAQILWDYVLHFNECRVSTQKLLNKISLLVVKTDIDAVLSSENGIQNFDAKMRTLKHYRDNDSVYVCDKTSEDVSNIQTSIAGCTDVVRQALEMVACINRTPAVKLLGISPSGFNATGESDLKNYYDYISSKQELYRDVLQKCIDAVQVVEFGEIDRNISFDFVDLNAENIDLKIQSSTAKLNALSALLDKGVMSAEELRQVAKGEDALNLDFLDDDLPYPDSAEDFLNSDDE